MLKVAIFNGPSSRERSFCPDPSVTLQVLRFRATSCSKVSAADVGTGSAQITMRIPAEHFDDPHAQLRAIAKVVERDTVEVRDVTRFLCDHLAKTGAKCETML